MKSPCQSHSCWAPAYYGVQQVQCSCEQAYPKFFLLCPSMRCPSYKFKVSKVFRRFKFITYGTYYIFKLLNTFAVLSLEGDIRASGHIWHTRSDVARYKILVATGCLAMDAAKGQLRPKNAHAFTSKHTL